MPQGGVHNGDHGIVRGSGRRGLDVDDQMGSLWITSLRKMDPVAHSRHVIFSAIACFRIIGGRDHFGRGGHFGDGSPAESARLFHVLFGPDLAQDLNGRYCRQFR